MSTTTDELNPLILKNWENLRDFDPEIYGAIRGEEVRETEGIELIPSENYTYAEVLAANGSVFTNKYAEGYPGRRYYGGQEYTDVIESLAIQRAKDVFKCGHANVQPLSGSPMNQAVYLGFLKPGDTILGMDLSHGGHLTHGHPVSHMGKIFNFVRYKTYPEEEGRIDEAELLALAKEHKPKMILCGYTSYPRDIDYAMFKRVADEVGALTMADVAHIGGLIAGGVMRNPFDYDFDIVTTTTHKSLRGPRGGMILCKEEHKKTVDKSVFPGLQGGPHMQTIASIAVTLKKAQEPEFKEYAEQVMKNSKVLAQTLMDGGMKLVTNGTDNHMMVMDTTESFQIGGTQAEEI
ncbi:MAG: serine hydroxymethyltransferase, partial [Rhodospirillales bacterium]|nr:serine hydroxymethyltransferase [Rhodospirillales bacterium]